MKLTLERVLVGILLVIAAVIVVHAPLTVWLGTFWPQQADFIKAWKEVLMGLALVLLLVVVARRKMVNKFLNDRLIQLALVYAGLHFIMIAVFDPTDHGKLQQAGAGLLIDLRYILYFVLVYMTAQLIPKYRRAFLYTIAGGAAVVLVFAVLQILVLPKDILKHIGYSKDTIAPFLTVDENTAYIRINSTLRGPNPLGAYAVIVISLLAATALRWKINWRGWLIGGAAALAAGLSLGASYSRSSVIGGIAALLVIGVIAVTPQVRKRMGIAAAVVTVVLIGTLFAFRNSSFVANTILHNNPTTGAAIDSNTGHVDSLMDGIQMVATQPFGAGVGSTGSASLDSNAPLIIENQYLMTAHEVGWLGLALFVWLFVEVMIRLWQRRKSALALGVFGAGVGLAIIGLLLPVWTDDTVSIVWWGLAAAAVGLPRSAHFARKSVVRTRRTSKYASFTFLNFHRKLHSSVKSRGDRNA